MSKMKKEQVESVKGLGQFEFLNDGLSNCNVVYRTSVSGGGKYIHYGQVHDRYEEEANVYFGNWVNDKMHGECRVIKGYSIQGNYVNGKENGIFVKYENGVKSQITYKMGEEVKG